MSPRSVCRQPAADVYDIFLRIASLCKTVVTAAAALLLATAPLRVYPAEVLGVLDYKALPEASGMALSLNDPNRIWFINDSGNRSELIALNLESFEFTPVNIKKLKNKDWEDLAAFRYQGESWLAIADVGDNDAKREKVKLYFLPERKALDRAVVIHTEIEIKYPDGPRDVESMAIDSETQTLYLLSKRDTQPRLYSLPLPNLEKGREYELEPRFLGVVESIPRPSGEELRTYPKYGANRHFPTGMTMLPDGSAIAVLTYRGAYLARLGAERDWLAALNESLCPVSTPALQQAESIDGDANGWLYVTSEGKNAPLLRLPATCQSDSSP